MATKDKATQTVVTLQDSKTAVETNKDKSVVTYEPVKLTPQEVTNVTKVIEQLCCCPQCEAEKEIEEYSSSDEDDIEIF